MECPTCADTFPNRWSLAAHIGSHRERPEPSPLPRHVLDVWPPPLPAHCGGCGRRVWLVENGWVDAPGTEHECGR